jgi:hypothetical protein
VSDADARGDRQHPSVDVDRDRHDLADAVGDLGRLPGVADLLEQDRELVAAETADRVGGAQDVLYPAGERDQQPVADGMAEAVVDELEAVEVDVEHGAAPGRIPLELAEAVLEAVQEQRPVRKAGEAVVQRFVDQPLLGVAPLGDVRQRAGDADRCAAGVAGGEPARQDPAPAAVGVADPVFALEVGAGTRQVMVDLALQPVDVVGVDELEPGLRPVRRELVVAEQRLPALGVVHARRHEVPVPDAVVGGAHRDRVPLLTAAQVQRRLVLA